MYSVIPLHREYTLGPKTNLSVSSAYHVKWDHAYENYSMPVGSPPDYTRGYFEVFMRQQTSDVEPHSCKEVLRKEQMRTVGLP